ncbi:molybdate ABC transporter permease subunit [Eilatimonas milleporae]|uniref:Molybdenum transport system permease n=1 Tax=Eilatimonas milleporae TaxID=911205 RepID=A0A3M0C524_9PROT|nr:molybdate ABC transporter permease subunit [Eilatimonas milleporae]RMB04924.1 molybdate transport system permease protein [Eilatimonas milleporae]
MLSDFELAALTLSLKVAFSATLIGLPAAIGLALVLARFSFPGKTVLDAVIHAPLVVPPVVVGYVLLILLAPATPTGRFLADLGLNPSFRWQGAALASGIMAFPLMVRAVRQSFEVQAPALRHVADTLGAGPMKRFLTISLPLAWPGLATALVLGFARAIGEFGATITFAANIPGMTQTLPLALYTAAQSPGGEGAALRLAVISLIPALLSLVLAEWLAGRARKRLGG